MSSVSLSDPVDINIITYSYSPQAFEAPKHVPTYTSFVFNTEKSVRHALVHWINVGVGNYGDIDLLFTEDDSKSHWSSLSKQEVLKMEVGLRRRKIRSVVQIVESLEEMWKFGMYSTHNSSKKS